MLEYCTDFEVSLCSDLANKHNFVSLIGHRSKLPDHSLLKITLNIARNDPQHPTNLPQTDIRNDRDTTTSTPDVKYNVRNVPNDFFSSQESRDELLNLINEQEIAVENQNNVNRYYSELVSCIFKEMDKYLPKIYGYGSKSTKQFKVKKPYWNNHLKQLWLTMCENEKIFLAYRGPNHIKQRLRKYFNDSSTIFNRELRKAERAYNKGLQNKIDNICTENPKQFWNYIKKLGPHYKPDIPQEVYDDDGNILSDLDSVLSKWKTEYENLYTTNSEQFDNNFYKQILDLLRTAENRMK